jgi:predicted PurR-regulated permease PerM
MSDQAAVITRRDLVWAAVGVVALLVVLLLLWQTRLLVLLTLLGFLLGIAATPAVDRLERLRIRRVIGAPLVVGGLIAIVLVVLAQSGPTIAAQVEGLRIQIPAAMDQLDGYLAREYGPVVDAILPRDTTDTSLQGDGATTRLRRVLTENLGSARSFLFGAVSSTVAGVGGVIYVVFLTIYFAIAPTTYRRGILFLVPPERRFKAAALYDAVIATLRTWLSTQLIAMLVIGVVTTIALLILGVKSAIPLGIIAGLLEFVPNVGPLLAAIPSVIIAFADSPEKALAVVFVYWGIQFLENNLLIPYLMQEELDLPPALTLLWQALMAIIFGFLGLFIAVPLLAAIMVAVRMVYVRGDVPPPRRPTGSRAVTAIDDIPDHEPST